MWSIVGFEFRGVYSVCPLLLPTYFCTIKFITLVLIYWLLGHSTVVPEIFHARNIHSGYALPGLCPNKYTRSWCTNKKKIQKLCFTFGPSKNLYLWQWFLTFWSKLPKNIFFPEILAKSTHFPILITVSSKVDFI